jgi:hypothetical protein
VRSDPSFSRQAGMPTRPALVIFGDFNHFRGSTVGKVVGRRFGAMPAAYWEGPSARPVALLKWAPWSKYQLSAQERARVPHGIAVVNDTHFHCDKTNVHRHMLRVFGYSSAVDPLRHVGPGVIKSNGNARHDGRVVAFPLRQLEDGDVVYERLIDNEADGEVREFRVPVVTGTIPFIYGKFRPVSARFAVPNTRAALVSTESVLSAAELALCLRFADSIGLDFGELDVLRSRDDGKIYIIDANNTPSGPPSALVPEERERARSLYADILFDRFFTAGRMIGKLPTSNSPPTHANASPAPPSAWRPVSFVLPQA